MVFYAINTALALISAAATAGAVRALVQVASTPSAAAPVV